MALFHQRTHTVKYSRGRIIQHRAMNIQVPQFLNGIWGVVEIMFNFGLMLLWNGDVSFLHFVFVVRIMCKLTRIKDNIYYFIYSDIFIYISINTKYKCWWLVRFEDVYKFIRGHRLSLGGSPRSPPFYFPIFIEPMNCFPRSQSQIFLEY